MLSRMLSKSGFSVSEFESGDDFLSHKDEFNTPSLIFMDHMMPGKDGLTTTRSLKQDGKFKDVPVIMYTSHDDNQYVDQIKQAGAAGILHKPAKQAELSEILSQNAGRLSMTKDKPNRNNDALLVNTIKTVKTLQAQVSELIEENAKLKEELRTTLNDRQKAETDATNHGSHVTHDALTASLRQLTKQFDDKLLTNEQKTSKQLASVKLSDHEQRELEHKLVNSAQRHAERAAEKVATSQAQAIAAKVAAAQSDLITRDALHSIRHAVKAPKLLATVCIVLTLFSIALHFVG